MKTNKVPKADVVIGGPPCQGFSLLNKNRSNDKRRALWEPFLDVVEASGARMFVMENVAELLASDEFKRIRKRAARLGFEVKAEVLNAADYGAPQTRRRTIAVGWKTSTSPAFPRSAVTVIRRSNQTSRYGAPSEMRSAIYLVRRSALRSAPRHARPPFRPQPHGRQHCQIQGCSEGWQSLRSPTGRT